MKNLHFKNYLIYALILIAGILIGLILIGTGRDDHSDHNHNDSTIDAGVTEYTCSMHPQVRQDEPGDCPICGMDLIPVAGNGDTGERDPFIYNMPEGHIQWANVQTGRVEELPFASELRLTGKVVVDEQQISYLSADFSGRVERLYVDYTGRYLKRGERVATVYSPEIMQAQKELLMALGVREQQPRLYEAAIERLKLFNITDKQINEIIDRGEASAIIDIYSSKSGYITRRAVAGGDYINTGQTLFTLTELDNVWVLLDAFESRIGGISLGDKVIIDVHTYPGTEISGNVSFIDPFVNPATRSVKVRVNVDNSNKLLKPEMLVRATVKSESHLGISDSDGSNMVFIPETAVLWTGTRSVVYVKKDIGDGFGFEYREIETGANTNSGYYVLTGLNAGEEIAVNGLFSIDAAAQLRGNYSMMSPPDREFLPEEQKSNFELLYNAYFELKNLLAGDEGSEKVLIAAGKLKEQLVKTGEHSVSGDHHMFWMERYKEINEGLEKFLESSDIAVFRVHFEPVSNALIKTARTMGAVGKTFYVAYCPMVDDNRGAYWLSEFEQISNPYFGSMMLRCGEVRETLREGVQSQTREAPQPVHNH